MLREKEADKYLGILEADSLKQVEMKENILKKCIRRTRKLLETKLHSRNLIKEINVWAVALVRYAQYHFWSGRGKNLNGPENKKTHDDA